jgi:hypothetical protein
LLCQRALKASLIHHAIGKLIVAGAPMASLPSQLEGKTLGPLLAGAPANGSAAAFTIYPRWREYDDHTHCFKPYSQIEAVGLSVRTATFRMTDWTAWNTSFNKPGKLRSINGFVGDSVFD